LTAKLIRRILRRAEFEFGNSDKSPPPGSAQLGSKTWNRYNCNFAGEAEGQETETETGKTKTKN
jgi:hypothetical protein